MPELPEVETVCRTLECLPGQRIEGVELFWERTLALDAELSGRSSAPRFVRSIAAPSSSSWNSTRATPLPCICA